MSYISTNQNRFYSALEPEYGELATVSESDRIPAVRLSARQEMQRLERRDKSGGRTFRGIPSGVRRNTSFELTTYMTSWPLDPSDTTRPPTYDALFSAAMGGGSRVLPSTTIVASVGGTDLSFASVHSLVAGQGISCGGEIRFVTSLSSDGRGVVLNAPFTREPALGTAVNRTITYLPGADLRSVSIYDYWSPTSAVHRILAGAAVDRLSVNINGDFHEFTFRGVAADLLDSASFESGQRGMTTFPSEPSVTALNYPVIPGNLGQAWLGTSSAQFLTITDAEIQLDNNLDMRAREFGTSLPRGIVAGSRAVTAGFSLYEEPDAATKALYRAARQRSSISVMFQLGIQPGQLCGIYMKSVVPEVPAYADDESRLQWQFRNCRAQGTIDDEIYIAFA